MYVSGSEWVSCRLVAFTATFERDRSVCRLYSKNRCRSSKSNGERLVKSSESKGRTRYIVKKKKIAFLARSSVKGSSSGLFSFRFVRVRRFTTTRVHHNDRPSITGVAPRFAKIVFSSVFLFSSIARRIYELISAMNVRSWARRKTVRTLTRVLRTCIESSCTFSGYAAYYGCICHLTSRRRSSVRRERAREVSR